MVDMAHESDDGRARFELFLLLNLWRWRRDDNLFNLVNTRAFFAAFFFQNESVALGDLRSDVGLDRLIDVGKNVEGHQLGDELMGFRSEEHTSELQSRFGISYA